jgi:hypothetical protein
MRAETHDVSERRRTVGTGSPVQASGADDKSNARDRLESWKQIAAFIERDERTAMRWAKELGMPVQRISASKRSRIYASRNEIEAWLSSQRTQAKPVAPVDIQPPPVPRSWPRAWFIAALATAVVVTTFIVWQTRGTGFGSVFGIGHKPPPMQGSFTESGIETFDRYGKHLWTYDFGRRVSRIRSPGRQVADYIRIADLQDRNSVLVAVPFRVGNNPDGAPESEIHCFSAGGRELWSYIPRETFRFGDYDVRGPWDTETIFISGKGRTAVIWVAFSEYPWGNSYVVAINPLTGLAVLRYVNTGDIRTLNELRTSRATYLVVGGFNNEHDSGILALIDERKPFAASPQTAGTRHKCVSCPAGEPDYYFVLPRSELNKARRVHENSVWQIHVDGIDVAAAQEELGSDNFGNAKWFEFRVLDIPRLIGVRYSSGYDMLHRELEQAGELGHKLERCPERLHPAPIRIWSPYTGWTEAQLPPRTYAQ